MTNNTHRVQITVEYAAQIRRAAGTRREEYELPASSSLCELLAAIAERHGEGLRSLIFEPGGATRKTFLVFAGDRQLPRNSPQQLLHGETITLMTPISGG